MRADRRAASRTIAVLGAGYAGLSAFLELQEQLRPGEADLVLVNEDAYHTFTTEIHTIMGGQDADDVRLSLDRVVRAPARLLVATVERIDPGVPSVRLAGNKTIDCVTIVAALGYEPEYYGIPGMREESHVLTNLDAALRLRQALDTLAAGTHDVGARAHVAIVGGGLTGVELAGEIADAYPTLALTLVEGAPEIMPGFEPQVASAARRTLESKGVRIRAGHQIARVDAGRLGFRSGAGLKYDTLVWAGGIRGSRLIGASDLRVNAKGQGLVDAYLRAQGYTQVFLAGDCSAPTDPASGRSVPPTAQAALQEGRAAARNLLRSLRGEALVPFAPHLRGFFVSLGRHAGVGRLGHATLYGIPAVAFKHLIEAQHAYDVGGLATLLGRVVHTHHGEPRPTPTHR